MFHYMQFDDPFILFLFSTEDDVSESNGSWSNMSVCRVTFNEGLFEPKSMKWSVMFYLL